MKPLLSIVIPTKDRYKYLIQLLDLIHSFNSHEIEVIVQDNTYDNSFILDYLDKNILSNVKYFHTREQLTSIQNFDKALLNSTGEYVCFIGDDDGVCRNIIDCVKWMHKNNIEAALPHRTYYSWPTKGRIGKLVVGSSKKVIEYLNPIKELVKVLKAGCQNLGNMPVTYTGIVKRYILDKIYKDFNSYFPAGASADISNGIALCFYVKRFVKLNFPIVITGTSEYTGGNIKRTKFIPFKQVPFISNRVGMEWEGDMPQYWFGCFVWPESAVKSLRALGKESFIVWLNYDKIFAHALIRAQAKPSIYYKYRSPIKLYFYIITSLGNRICTVLINRLHNVFIQRIRYSNVESIKNAEQILNKFTKDFNKLSY